MERNGIKGGCLTCYSLYDLHQARLMLDSVHRDCLRKAIPWTRKSEPRKPLPLDPTDMPM